MTKTRNSVAMITALLASTALAVPAAAQTVTIMQGEAPQSMEPGTMGGTYNMSVLDAMYENLVALDEDLTQQPGLATEWSVSEDGMTWTFTLREGVTFHDGTPFDADAVVYTFERLLDESLGLPSGGRFRPIIDSVTAVDPMTAEFSLKTVYPAFPALMAMMHAAIVSPEAGEAGTLETGGGGTGPFELVEWSSGEFVLQQAYDGYWGDAPEVDELRWVWTPEASVASMALMAGEVDVVNAPAPTFAQQIEAADGFELNSDASSRVFWAALNTQIEPFDSMEVRQAVNYATDREALVQALLFGYGSPANSPLGEAVFGYDDTLEPYTYDIDMARQLLEEAGYPDGVEVNLFVQEQETQIAQALQGMWEPAGIQLNITRLESGVMSDVMFAGPEEKAEQDVDMVIASFSSATLDADTQLRALYHSDSFTPTDANIGFYHSERLDEVLDEAASISDTDRRMELYLEAQNIINEEAPHVLLYKPVDLYATRSGIEGVWVRPGGLLVAKGVSVAE
ncbi:ABC transporter substrate-binding protein [Pelagovum pacificum]|uniref:Glycosyl transferase n=1 Tax=Pelagovum pacificum TaxID=2588711 RepID=A0A5C5GEZ4_9RHOB|nr:ABC transporter substrate-binding protein [Pelagovum pacificum]QQA44251.1 glycosyl transferase [Pelagovum pacificum]TNY32627.1 glycosyl transferase [Pelagovum pacificum]